MRNATIEITDETEISETEQEMNQAAIALAEAVMWGADTAKWLEAFKAARQRHIFGD
jgi:hypothetical protein